ncbi:TPA: conjugal transfer protein TraF, partial [Photobacterium damselae]
PLLGVTLDDTPLSSIKSNRANQGKLAVKVDPALLLVNPNTGQMKPLAYGFISQDELLGRFLNVATQYAPDF